MSPCDDCPFRTNEKRLPLTTEDAESLALFSLRTSNVTICHKTEGTARELGCVGALRFYENLHGETQSSEVFASVEDMTTTHAKSQGGAGRALGRLYGIEDDGA